MWSEWISLSSSLKTWREFSFVLRDSEVRVAKLRLAKGKHPSARLSYWLDQTELCFPDLVSHRVFLVAFHLSGDSPQVFFSFMLQEKTPQVMDTGSHGNFDVKLDTLPKTNVNVDLVLTYFSCDSYLDQTPHPYKQFLSFQ